MHGGCPIYPSAELCIRSAIPFSLTAITMHQTEAAWFCIRSRPKHEHIAAAHLRQLPGVEVFNPRLRFLRSTRRGRALVTESLFPNYLFARFVLNAALDRVSHASGVNTVVRFGDRVPAIPHEVIHDLQNSLL